MLSVSNHNIILIGFMGSGKSTIGRKIAKRIQKLFFDTDLMIEDKHNKKVSDIFKEDGEQFFRDEEIHMAHLLHYFVKASVIATGGGLPIAVTDLHEQGLVVFLDIDFDFMMSRMSKEDIEQRPLLQDLDKARALYESRREIYEKQAQLTIKINRNNNDYDDIMLEILNTHMLKILGS